MGQHNQTLSDNQLQELKSRLTSRAENGRISCKAALETAQEFGVSPAFVGRALNDLEIRIKQCQLGCF